MPEATLREPRGTVRFGAYELCPERGVLFHKGVALKLQPQPLRALAFLIDRAPEIVSREALADHIWGHGVHVEIEQSLNYCISQIRQVLNDRPSDPKFVETLPRQGYRFIATVTQEPSTSDMPADEAMGADAPSAIDPESIVDFVPRSGAAMPGASMPGTGLPRLKWLLFIVGLGLAAILCLWIRQRMLHTEKPIRSLAVLPLEDLSPGPREEYFADGMTDELITELAHIPGLQVVSRTSVMQDKGAHKSLAQMARELDVDAIVEGSVVRSGDRARITAQLIDTRSDRHLWAQSFEGPLGDILSLQDSVAREIARQTSSVLTPAARAEMTSARHVNPEAHDAYLRGLYFIQRREGNLAASYFRKAIALEPDYGAANAGLAEALVTQYIASAKDAAEIMPVAIAAARRAIELDPYSGEGYTALGAIDTNYLCDWTGAERNLRKGIELSPSSSDAETWYAVYLTSVGRPAEAVNAMQRAVTLDPLSFWVNRLLGSMLYYARRYDESLAALKRASEIAPDKFQVVEVWNSRDYETQGRYSEALAADLKEEVSELSPDDINSFRSAFAIGGWKAYQEARVKFLRPRSVNQCDINYLAMSYVRLGNPKEAFRWFDRDLDKRCSITVFDLSSDPRLDTIRGDARFRDLLRRVHLPH